MHYSVTELVGCFEKAIVKGPTTEGIVVEKSRCILIGVGIFWVLVNLLRLGFDQFGNSVGTPSSVSPRGRGCWKSDSPVRSD